MARTVDRNSASRTSDIRPFAHDGAPPVRCPSSSGLAAARFVSPHRDLDAVAGVELAHEAGEVGLATVAGASIGDEWLYYLLGSVVEGMLLLGIARVAWRWPHASDTQSHRASNARNPGFLSELACGALPGWTGA